VKRAVLPRNVHLSILLVQLVAIATLMRSIAFDRWITILASIVLLVGAAAAKRNRAWGVALMFAQAIAFPVAFIVGIAPAWFCLVGALGMIPFMLTAPGFARVDRGATRLLAALAFAGGSLGAIVWKKIAWDVFDAIPFFYPSVYPHHGWIVAAVAALGLGIAFRDRKLVDAEAETNAFAGASTNARIAVPMRIERIERIEEAAPIEDEADEEAEAVLGKRQRS
jgi:hypothetical protein